MVMAVNSSVPVFYYLDDFRITISGFIDFPRNISQRKLHFKVNGTFTPIGIFLITRFFYKNCLSKNRYAQILKKIRITLRTRLSCFGV